MKPSKLYLFFTLALITFTLNISSCKDKKIIEQTKVTFVKEAELSILQKETNKLLVKLDIEIADTNYDIQTGLMYRDSMKPKQGMLFIFKDLKQRNFYMKNTRIPLDIVFIDNNKTIVSIQKNTKPFDETSLPSNAPAKYVLEVNAGQIDALGVKIGDQLFFKM